LSATAMTQQRQHQCEEETLPRTDTIDHGNDNVLDSSLPDELQEELLPPPPPAVCNEIDSSIADRQFDEEMQQQEQQMNQVFAEENGNTNAIGSTVSNEVESELPSQPLPLDGEETEQMQQYFAEESHDKGTTATSFQDEILSELPTHASPTLIQDPHPIIDDGEIDDEMHQQQQSFTEENCENVIDTPTSTDDETEFSTPPLPSFCNQDQVTDAPLVEEDLEQDLENSAEDNDDIIIDPSLSDDVDAELSSSPAPLFIDKDSKIADAQSEGDMHEQHFSDENNYDEIDLDLEAELPTQRSPLSVDYQQSIMAEELIDEEMQHHQQYFTYENNDAENSFPLPNKEQIKHSPPTLPLSNNDQNSIIEEQAHTEELLHPIKPLQLNPWGVQDEKGELPPQQLSTHDNKSDEQLHATTSGKEEPPLPASVELFSSDDDDGDDNLPFVIIKKPVPFRGFRKKIARLTGVHGFFSNKKSVIVEKDVTTPSPLFWRRQ